MSTFRCREMRVFYWIFAFTVSLSFARSLCMPVEQVQIFSNYELLMDIFVFTGSYPVQSCAIENR